MSEALKAIVRTVVETIFSIVTGPGSEAEKVAKLERAAAALASEKASEAAIDEALK